ncbi:MAG: two-component hybrid sensor and regulator [Actinomycetia bacterium]|nr:two-component hybrid sensor and regulator [Actinomycetes bacterium]
MTAQQFLRRVVRIQGIILAAALLLSTAGVLTYRWAADRVRETSAVLVDLQSLRSEVLGAESALRGYVITTNDAFLAPYEAAAPNIKALSTRLEERLAPRDDAAFAAITELIRAWRVNFATPVLFDVASGHRDAAVAFMETQAGKRRIDKVQVDLAALSARLRDQENDRQRAADEVGWVSVAGTLLGVVLILGIGGQLRRRLNRRIAGPLEELADVTGRFGSGELTARAGDDGVIEVQRVSAAFNAMAERTQAMVVELMAVDRLKSEFVSVVSHELRTPLTSIRGSLGLLSSGAMGELPSDASEMVAIATSNTDRLVRLINDILDLERIEGGHEALELRMVPVAELLDDAASAVRGAAQTAGVAIEVEAPDIAIEVDGDRMIQAVTNLLGNAVKFSEPGSTVVVDAVVRGHQIALQVRDQGRGIPPDMLEAVFERFQQVDASDAREKGGTGLGLAIVRTIVQRHGGRVEVTSTVGEGSCFSIVLPIMSQAPTEEARADRGGAAVVVLVEDDPDLRLVVGALLGRHGIDVATAETAQEAIERCRTAVPDVLVLDVSLAEGDGYDVVQALRQDDRLRSLPTVVYTAAILSPAQRDRLRLGDTVFVAKGQRDDQALEHEVMALLARIRS